MKQQPDHSSRGHAEFSPSSLKYVSKCAGFHGREGTNASAEMGTRIHEALEIFDPSALHNEHDKAYLKRVWRDKVASDFEVARALSERGYYFLACLSVPYLAVFGTALWVFKKITNQ